MKHGWISILSSVVLVVGLTMLPTPKPVYAEMCTSTGTGNWSIAGTWSCVHVPVAGDGVAITAGHTVTVDTDTANLDSLTINGTLRFDNSGTGKSMTVTGDVTINSGGTLDVATGGSATTHSLTIGGNVTNDGTFDCLPATDRIINVMFNKDGNQTISGTGTTKFNNLTLNMGTSKDNVLDVQAVTTMADGGLTLTNGTFKLSSASTITPFTTGPTIPSTAGFWVNGGTVNTGNLTWRLSGLLRVSDGTLTIGTSSGNSVNYDSGSIITIEGGALSIAGRLSRRTTTQTTTYTQSGGTVTVVTVKSTSGSYAGFDIGATGSSFTMSGGTIVIQQETSCTSGDYLNLASTYNVTGGTLQIGNSNTLDAQTIEINSTAPVWDLTVDGSTGEATKPTAQLLTNGLNIDGDLTIQTGTTLNANDLDIALAGDWTNDGTFTTGTGMVTFNGTGISSYGGSSTTTFNNLTINSSATLDISTNTIFNVSGTMTNNGMLKQTKTVNQDATTSFLNVSGTKYYGVDITLGTVGDMGSTVVSIKGNQTCGTTGSLPDTVKRCYEITPATSRSATVKFYYRSDEANSNTSPNVYHWNSSTSTWDLQTLVGRGGSGEGMYVEASGISSYSPFALGDNQPTAVTLSSLTARSPASQPTSFRWQWLALAGAVVAFGGGAAVRRLLRR